jgi:hypothetical protein
MPAATSSSTAAAIRLLARAVEVDAFGAGLVTLFAAGRPAFAFFGGMVLVGFVVFECRAAAVDDATANEPLPIPSSESESTNCSKWDRGLALDIGLRQIRGLLLGNCEPGNSGASSVERRDKLGRLAVTVLAR